MFQFLLFHEFHCVIFPITRLFESTRLFCTIEYRCPFLPGQVWSCPKVWLVLKWRTRPKISAWKARALALEKTGFGSERQRSVGAQRSVVATSHDLSSLFHSTRDSAIAHNTQIFLIFCKFLQSLKHEGDCSHSSRTMWQPDRSQGKFWFVFVVLSLDEIFW